MDLEDQFAECLPYMYCNNYDCSLYISHMNSRHGLCMYCDLLMQVKDLSAHQVTAQRVVIHLVERTVRVSYRYVYSVTSLN